MAKMIFGPPGRRLARGRPLFALFLDFAAGHANDQRDTRLFGFVGWQREFKP